jgi:hypothetical protein
MKALLNLFRRTRSTSNTTTRRPQAVRPSIEVLEDRLALSASSFNLHAVLQSNGDRVAFFRNPADNAFYEKTPDDHIVQISGPNTVTDFSAGLDRSGLADVFAHVGRDLEEFSNGAWHSLNQPMYMEHFAAVKGGRLYAEGHDYSLWEYTTPYMKLIYNPVTHVASQVTVGGWTQVWGANSTWALDAVTSSSGVDAVFVMGGDNRLREYSQGKWTGPLDYQGDGVYMVSFSAGLDVNGNACVAILHSDGYLSRDGADPNTPAMFLHVDPLATISATTGGQVFVQENSALYVASGFNTLTGVAGSANIGTITAVSAVGVDDVFVMTSGGFIKEHNPPGWISFN